MTDEPGSGDSGAVSISSTKDLLDALDLQDIYFLALRADRTSSDNPDLLDGALVSHQVQDRRSETELHVRIESTVEAHDATYVVDLVTKYASEQAFAVDSDGVVRDFIERVAMMAAWPYIRQQVSELSSTFRGEHVLLPLLRPGDITLSVLEENGSDTLAEE
jgi:hypothetical protein